MERPNEPQSHCFLCVGLKRYMLLLQGQGVNQIQTMQLQMQLARLQQQQQLVRQHQAAAAVQQQQQQQQATPYSGGGLERFFNTATAPGIQRMPAVPNQVPQAIYSCVHLSVACWMTYCLVTGSVQFMCPFCFCWVGCPACLNIFQCRYMCALC